MTHVLVVAMQKKGWGPAKLAEVAKVKQPSISAYLNGRRGLAQDTAQAIVIALGGLVPLDQLLFSRPTGPSPWNRRKRARAA